MSLHFYNVRRLYIVINIKRNEAMHSLVELVDKRLQFMSPQLIEVPELY